MGEVRPRRSGLRREVRPAAARRQHASGGRELAPRRPRGQRGTARAAGLRLTAARCGVGRRGAGVHRRGRAGRARRSPGGTAQCRHAPRARGAALFRDPHNPRTAGASSRRWTARERSTRAGVVRNRHRARSARTGSHPSPGLQCPPGEARSAPSAPARRRSGRRPLRRSARPQRAPSRRRKGHRRSDPSRARSDRPALDAARRRAPSQVDTPRSRPRHALSCSGTRRPAKLSPLCLLCLRVSNSKTHSLVLVL